jgi:hypothetical protein
MPVRRLADRCLQILRLTDGRTNNMPLSWPALSFPIPIRETAPEYLA